MTTVLRVSIEPELARKLRAVRSRLDRDTIERNALIAQAVANGGSLREVGELVGLSHTRVRQIADAQPSE